MKKDSLTPIRSTNISLPSEYQQPLGFHDDYEAGSEEAQIREYWKVTLKYRTLLIACTCISSLLALMYAFLATPLYTSSSKIRIGTYEPVLAATKIEGIMQEKSKEANYLETQIQEIKSYSLADKVLSNQEIEAGLFAPSHTGFIGSILGSSHEQVQRQPDTVSGYQTPIAHIRDYLDLISVSPIRRTSLVSISATTKKPVLSAKIANAHAEQYIEWVRQNRVNQQSRAIVFLEKQARELRSKVADLERDLADYAEENSIVAVNSDENITAQRMSQLSELLTDTTAKRIEAEHGYKAAQESLQGASSAAFDDPSTQSLRTELATLQGEYQQLSAKFTDAYPRMIELRSKISGLKDAIAQGRKQLVQGLKSRAEALRQEEKRLREELDKQTSVTFDLAKRKVQYNVLSRELESSRELLQNVLRQLKESSLAVEGNSSNVTVVDYAVIPSSPSYPRKTVVLFIGLLFGLGTGLFLAFTLNYLDNTIRTPEELTGILNLPNLGVVPSFEGTRLTNASVHHDEDTEIKDDKSLVAVGKEHFPIAFLQDSRSLCAEAYRTIRTAILLSQAGEPPRTILVTSAQSSEGKTTSVMNLAVSLSSAGARVAIIDADLRRPSLGRYFQSQGGLPGIVEVLTGGERLENVAVNNFIKRISFFPSGKIPPNPAELLGSPEMAVLIDELGAQYDYVLIDSPPVLPVTDAVILSRYVDGVVLVVKGANTPKKIILDSKRRLEAVGARFLGTILNDIDLTAGDYYYYNKYYSSYYSSDDDETGKRAGGI